MENTYWKNRKVLVTGGMGFIGSHFVEELLTMQCDVTCVDFHCEKTLFDSLNIPSGNLSLADVDLQDTEAVQKVVSGHDLIINCAALDGNAEFKAKNAARILDVNMKIVSNILNAAQQGGVQDVVLLSSAEVYPASAQSPIKEDDDYRVNFDNLQNGYALSKRYAELLADLYSKQYGLHIYLPRPTNVYGPRDNFGDQSSRVIPGMLKKVLSGKAIELWGDGKQVRNFVYVKDLVHMILATVQAGVVGRINIATDEPITILELAQIIAYVANKQPSITLLTEKPAGIKERVLDTAEINVTIDFVPQPLKEGLIATLVWYAQKNTSTPNFVLTENLISRPARHI